jgi:hypothetical protein
MSTIIHDADGWLRTTMEDRMIRSLLCAAVLGLAVAGLAAEPAVAFTKVPIGKRTKEYIRDNLCKGPGRRYVEGQGQYGCISNCNGQEKASDACGINCSEKDNECYGWSPGTERSSRSTPDEVMNPKTQSGKKTDSGKSR